MDVPVSKCSYLPLFHLTKITMSDQEQLRGVMRKTGLVFEGHIAQE